MSAEPSEEQPRPIIRITKKKIIAAGHHGGSWKVAYADFVTAMMAFFLVMWIVSMDQATKEEIQDYFNNPFSASTSKAGISKMAMGGTNPISIGSGMGLSARRTGVSFPWSFSGIIWSKRRIRSRQRLSLSRA